jgi:hypothetical protein
MGFRGLGIELGYIYREVRRILFTTASRCYT